MYGAAVTYVFLFVDDDTDLYNTAYAYNTGRNYSMFQMTLLLMSASNGVVNSSRSLSSCLKTHFLLSCLISVVHAFSPQMKQI